MIQSLLNRHYTLNTIHGNYLLQFLGIEDKDVYNVSKEFSINDKTYILGRVEGRTSEISDVFAFEKIHDWVYKKVDDFFIKNFQDPCVTFIDSKIIIGGTKIIVDNDRITSWHTCFYKGENMNNLTYLCRAPDKMKDVRIVSLGNKIGIFTRPQGGKFLGGRVGFTMVDSLNEVNSEVIENASIINLFDDDTEWGGVNDVVLLKNGLLGVLGHIACFSGENIRHYYSLVFGFNPVTHQVFNPKIVLTRDDITMNKNIYKRPDLKDVLFSGGIQRLDNNTALLFTGVSDCKSYVAIIDDPFMEYENL